MGDGIGSIVLEQCCLITVTSLKYSRAAPHLTLVARIAVNRAGESSAATSPAVLDRSSIVRALSKARRQLDDLSAQVIAFELEIGMPRDAIAAAQWRIGRETGKRLKLMAGKVSEIRRLTTRPEALKDRRQQADEFASTR
jgi:hypothetical protein